MGPSGPVFFQGHRQNKEPWLFIKKTAAIHQRIAVVTLS